MATSKKAKKKTAAPKKVAAPKVEKPAEVPAKEVKKEAAPAVKQGQVNEIASTVRKIKNWLEEKMGADIDGDGRIGMTYLPVMVLVLAGSFLAGIVANAGETLAVRYLASEGCDNIIELNADNADDTDDKLELGINTDNDFTVLIGDDEVLNITKDGALTATTITAGSINYGDGVTADVEITLTDTDGDATITSRSASGAFDGILVLDADHGDDNADTWTIKSEASGNDLSVLNHTTEVLNLTTAGALSVDAGVAAGDAVTLTDANGAAVISAIGLTGDYDASLILDADAGNQAADTWTITSQGTGNDLSVINASTEVFNLTSSGALQIDGDLTVSGNDIDSGAATMTIGASAATKLELADTGITIDCEGPVSAAENILSDEVDTLTATTLLLGKSTATRVELGDTAIVVETEGPLHATEFVLSDEVDALTATTLSIGKATATKLEVADTAVTTEVQGPLTVLGSTGAGVDAMGATALYIGEATATSVVLAATGVETDVAGTLSVDEAAVFDSTVTITGVATLTAAPVVTVVTAVGTATALMTNAPAITEETPVWVTVSYGGSDYVVPMWLKD